MRRSSQALAAVAAALGGCFFGISPSSASTPVVTYGPSDAASVAVLSGQPGYKNSFWWDHTALTVAVRSGGNVQATELRAIHDAISLWRAALAQRFPLVSLTDVTATTGRQAADIVVNYVPHAGGVVWGGTADCGVQRCLNVIVRSNEPNPKYEGQDFNLLRIQRETVHELGHALGLGHTTPLDTPTDIMGYGWSRFPQPDLTPILSDCDFAALAMAFDWAVTGEAPHRSPVPEVAC